MVKWEELKSTPNDKLKRAKVPGGWFVEKSYAGRLTMIFYPDPNHEWKGDSLP